MAAKWYYQQQGTEIGPVSGSELRRLAQSGNIGPATRVRKEDGHWVDAKRVSGLFPSTNPGPPTNRISTGDGASAGALVPPPPPSITAAASVVTVVDAPATKTELSNCSVLVDCSCGHTIRASESSVGKKQACPSCNREVRIRGGRICTHEIFICHSTKDASVAEAVCQSLENRGRKCWIAPRDVPVGQKWASTIIEAITGSRVIVLVHSAHSNRSPQVLREVERAVAKSVAIVPIKIDKTPLSRDLEYFLGPTHWFDASDVPLAESINDLTLMVESLVSGRVGSSSVRQIPRKRLLARRLAFGAISFLAGVAVAMATVYFTRGPSRYEMSPELAEMVRSKISVESWEEVGGMASLDEYENLLVVTATFQIQQQVNQFLNHLRANRGLARQDWKPSGETEAMARILEVLEETTSAEFVDVPLEDAMLNFSASHNVRIVIDTRSLENVGLDSQYLVSLDTKGLPLKDAFELLLRDLDLTFTVRESGIMIMTEEDAETKGQLTVAHDVSDLLADYRGWLLPYEPKPVEQQYGFGAGFGTMPNDVGAGGDTKGGGLGNSGGIF